MAERAMVILVTLTRGGAIELKVEDVSLRMTPDMARNIASMLDEGARLADIQNAGGDVAIAAQGSGFAEPRTLIAANIAAATMGGKVN